MKNKKIILLFTFVALSTVTIKSYGMEDHSGNKPLIDLPDSKSNWLWPDIGNNQQVKYIVTQGLNKVETIAQEYREAMDKRVEEATHKTTQALENIGKSLRISAVGIIIGTFGVKFLYDGLYEIMDKLEREENQEKRWWNTLTKKDYLKSAFGTGGVLVSLLLIIKSDSLAEYVG